MSEPETISWRDALRRIIEMGHAEDAATIMLVEAVASNAVDYYPRRALDLGRAHRAGLFDPKTGDWRMHSRDDHPLRTRLIRSEFERWLSKLRQPSKAGQETKAIDFLSDKLKADPELARNDAWIACKNQFPTLSKRRFVYEVWPSARKNAGLEPHGSPGRKRKP
jgi:hypothetical protein